MSLLERLLSGGGKGGPCPHECAACSESLPSASALVHHLVRKHFRGTPFPCVVLSCGEMVANVRELYEHLRKHAGEDLHACGQCGHSFSTPSSLRRHARLGGCGGVGGVHECRQCGRTFSSAASLKRHARAHERGRACKACGTRFAVEAELHAHERSIHDLYRGYECGSCECAFTRWPALHRHLERVHAQHAHREPGAGVYEHRERAVEGVHAHRDFPQLDHNGNESLPPLSSSPEPSPMAPDTRDPVHPGSLPLTLSLLMVDPVSLAATWESPSTIPGAASATPGVTSETSTSTFGSKSSRTSTGSSSPSPESSTVTSELLSTNLESSVVLEAASFRTKHSKRKKNKIPRRGPQKGLSPEARGESENGGGAARTDCVADGDVVMGRDGTEVEQEDGKEAAESIKRVKKAAGSAGSWRCAECGSRFGSARALRKHLLRHLQMRRSRKDRFPLWAIL